MAETIFITDPLTSGHHKAYQVLLSSALATADVDIDVDVHLLTGDRPALERLMKEHAPECCPNITFHQIDVSPREVTLPVGRYNQLLTVLRLWYHLFRSVKRIEKKHDIIADLVFLPWLDSFISDYHNNWYVNRWLPFFLRWITHRPWSGIYFHPRYLRRPEKYPMLERNGTSVSTLFTETGCRMLFTLDEGIRDKLAKDLEPVSVRWLPDIPLTCRCDFEWPELDNIKQQAGDKAIMLLTGVLNRFKGVEEFIKLAAKPSFNGYFFVLAGRLNIDRLSAEVRKKIKNKAIPNLYVYPEFIPTEEQMNALIASSDMIYLHYKKFTHSSSLQVKAAKLETPAIVINDHLMRERAKEWGGSLILDHPSELTPQKLEKLLETEYNQDTNLESFSFQQFSQKIGCIV